MQFIKGKKNIKQFNWMKCFGKTHHKPQFQYMCISLKKFDWISFYFWNIGIEGDAVMDAVYKSEQN